MNNRLVYLAAVLAAFHSTGSAQTPTPIPPPHAPFVAAPRPGTSWRISVKVKNQAPSGSSKRSAATPPRTPSSIYTRCGSEANCVVVSWSDGTQSTAYIVGNKCLRKNPDGSIASSPAQDQDYALPVYTRGYQGTAWVDLSGYKQVEALGILQTYRYLGHFEVEIVPGPNLQVELEAWIDVNTGVPVRIATGNFEYNFSPVTETTDPFVLPPEFKAFAGQVGKEENALEMMRRAAQAQGR